MPLLKLPAMPEPGTRKMTLIAFWLIAVAVLLRIIFSWISLVNLPVTSDEASSVLLAKMISRGELPLLFIGQPYQFPIESYLMAPFVEWLPRTPLGARYQMLIMGMISFWGFYSIVRLAFPARFRWPAVLLICFPSAYFLTFLAAYAPPQYSISLTLAWVSIYTVLRSRQGSGKKYLFLMVSGFCCGLAISNHLLTVTITAGVFALVLFSGPLRKSLQATLIFSLCCLAGAIPYILAKMLIPGAYKNLPISMELADAIVRMIAPALSTTLPGAMGVNPILFPDLSGQVYGPASLRTVFAIFYTILLLVIIVQRLQLFCNTLREKKWPRLELVDLALIASLLTLWVFASHFTSSKAYRYMLPAVWCFPFLIAHAYSSFPGRFRTIVGAAAVCLALFNIAVSITVISLWSDTGELEKYSHTPKIEKLIDTLQERKITHCYASFWFAYRITFETDEKIICRLPYNQRFPLWPIPYKAEVEDQPDSVYILTNRFRPRLSARQFEKQLSSYGVTAQRTKVGPFFIYHDFNYPTYRPGEEYILEKEEYSLQTNGGKAAELVKVGDGDISTSWVSNIMQKKGQWITVTFNTAQVINGITILHLPGVSNKPKSLKIDGYTGIDGDKGWHPLTGPLETKSDRFRFVNNHPVYSGLSQQIRFDPVELEALRIEIVEPANDRNWGITDIEVSALAKP